MRLLFIWLALFLTSTVAKAVDAEAIKDPRLKQIAWSDPGKQELYTETNRPELYCLALNIYHEAKSESLAGQFAVADVVLNRVNDVRYPDTICGVVLEAKMRESWKTKQHKDLPDDERIYYPVRNMCQFSWYCDGKSDKAKDSDSWRRAQVIAYMLHINRKYRGITEGSTHYHATYVSPKWAPELDLVGRIGTHIFYRWP